MGRLRRRARRGGRGRACRRGCRRAGRGADRVHRHPGEDGRQEDQRDQGGPHHHRPRPEGGQGPGRGCAEAGQGRHRQGRGRQDQARCSRTPAPPWRSSSTNRRTAPGARARRTAARADLDAGGNRARFPPRSALRRQMDRAAGIFVAADERIGRQAAVHERDQQVVYRAQADPSQLRAHPRGGADAEPDRRAARLLRGVPADERPARQPAACRAAGSVQVGIPDRRLRRARTARVRLLRAGGAEIRRRGVHPAGHDLCRAAEGHSAPDRLGRGRGHRRAVDPRHQGTARLHGRHAADDRQRHVHHQWHRARHRLADAPFARRVLRPRQGQDALVAASTCSRRG